MHARMELMSDLSGDPTDIGRRLCAVLDPLMTSRGFQSGQVGSSSSEVGIVYCSPHADFRSRFPSIAPRMEYSDEGACTDLNIYVALSPGSHLREIHLDGHELDELLRDAGRGDLQVEVESLAELSVDEGAERLRTILTAVFADQSGTPAPEEEDSDV